jgi:hypothetical protein
MRFAFLRRGNRRRTKVESAYAKSLKKSRAPFGRYSRLWLALTAAADCSLTLIVTELRLRIEANAIRQLVPPEASEEERRQRRVTCRVLDIAVPEVRLQRPRVDAVLCQLESAGMPSI